MTRLLKNITAIVVIAMIISVIAIPAFAAVNALSSTAGWSSDDLRNVAWATLSYSGGNGNTVVCSAYATTNIGNMSTLLAETTALSATFKGTEVSFGLSIPIVISYGGEAVYK